MSAFVTDTFTDTNSTALDSHTGELGATWTKHTSYSTSNFQIQSNKCDQNSTGNNGCYYASGSPATADYSVSCIIQGGETGATGVGIAGRIATGANTMYHARFATGSGWQLFKFVAGASTQLGSTASATLTNGQNYTLKLDMSGTSISLYVDGVLTVGPITDSAISAAGFAGVRMNGKTSGTMRVDTFSADQAGGSDTSLTPSAGTLSFSGVSSSLGLRIAAAAGSLTLSSVAATLSQGSVLSPVAGALTLNGLAASLQLGIIPGVGSLLFASDAPSVINSGSGSRTITPLVGALALSGIASAMGLNISPPVGTLSLIGLQSVLGRTLTPGAGSLLFAGLQGNLNLGVIPASGVLSLVGIAGLLNFTVMPGSGVIVVTGTTPGLSRGLPLTPGAVGLLIGSSPPSVGWNLIPDTGLLSVVGLTPIVTATGIIIVPLILATYSGRGDSVVQHGYGDLVTVRGYAPTETSGGGIG